MGGDGPGSAGTTEDCIWLRVDLILLYLISLQKKVCVRGGGGRG